MINNLELELFRLSPEGGIRVLSVETGSGNIRCGNYQFAFRLINEVTGKSTKFSLFTNPVSINSVSGTGDQSGPVNTFSNKSIVLSVDCSTNELTQYENIQIGVIENNSGLNSNSLNVSILGSFPMQGTSNEFKYSSNEREGSVDLAEIAIDDAPILTFKSLMSKNNRLVGGNVKYKNLEFDNGNPAVSSGAVIHRRTPMIGPTDKAKSESKGHFADEVYRYYVAFWDGYGDFSRPKTLDMSNVVGNLAQPHSGGFKDMKFPKRDNANRLLEVGSEGRVEANNMGVRVTVTNIPTWAKGAVILRAERKKNIIFQSPIIPTTTVQPPDAQANYPGENRQVPNPMGTLAPKNMMFSLNKAILREGATEAQSEWAANYDKFEHNKKIHVAFPPEAIFNNSGIPYYEYIKNGSLFIENTDYCVLRKVSSGEFNKDDRPVEFYRKASADTIAAFNPFDYATFSKSRSSIDIEFNNLNRPITDEVNSYGLVPNEISAYPVIGISGKDIPTSMFGAYSDLEIVPDGAYNGQRPANQRCVVFTTGNDRQDISYHAVSGSKAGYNTTTSLSVAAFPSGTGSTFIQASDIRDVKGQNSNPDGEAGRSFVEIVNFKAGLSDDRYGTPSSRHTLVSTGAVASFDNSPNEITFDIFGGDCFITPFTFKVHDTHYGVLNSNHWMTAVPSANHFKDSANRYLRRPISYRSLGVNVGVYLESEINGLCVEEFLTMGDPDHKYKQNVTVSPFGPQVVLGNIYKSGSNYFRALISSGSANEPRSIINANYPKVTNIGYDFEDLGTDASGQYYAYKRSPDNFIVANSLTEAQAPLNYLYSPEYSFSNRSKPFPFIANDIEFNRVSFASRLVYSDTKILQTNLDGFSRMRAANIFDLEESKGAITALEEFNGRMFAVQRFSFCYVPFEANILETTDSETLAIQSATVVGNPQYVGNFGSDHIRSVSSTPMGLMFFDSRNSKLVVYRGETEFINSMGVSSYIEKKASEIKLLEHRDSHVQTYYDYNKNEAVMKIGNEALVFDTEAGVVKSILRPNAGWAYGTYNDSEHILVGDSSMVSVINSADGNRNMLGVPFSSEVKFVINEEFFMTKMFYFLKFISVNPENVVIRAMSNGEVRSEYSGVTERDRRAGFLLNKVRDNVDKRRLRGEYAEVITTVNRNEIISVLGKIQATHRII